MKIARALLGGRLFELLMKSTFYGHFVAGEDRYTIVPKLERFFFYFLCFVFFQMHFLFAKNFCISHTIGNKIAWHGKSVINMYLDHISIQY